MDKKVALITGITGQDGSYLAEFLIEKGYEVHGLLRRSSSFNTGRIEHLYLDEWVRDMKKKRLVNLHWADMTDSSSLSRVIGEVRPTRLCYALLKQCASADWRRPFESIRHLPLNSMEKCRRFRSRKRLHSILVHPTPSPNSMDSGS